MTNRFTLGAVLLLASLVLGGAARAEDPPPYEAPEPLQTPPGSKEDQALWWRAMDASNEISTGRAAAAKLQWRTRSGDYAKRLAEKAKGLPAPEAERLTGLAKTLQAAWSANYALLSSRWPVDPTRGCGYPAQQLESAMHAAPLASQGAAIDGARKDARQCVDLAEAVLRRLHKANDDLAKALAAADAALKDKAR
ncbi:MAG TPA: hypothetical protein PLL32_09675 [Anaeromyxobacteraceae bacterium]|nr:hypothetical protein [Anaeromyxobacteraceae bacterium]